MTFTPTEEQIAVVKAGAETSDNLIINAYAGAAKTTTLILMAEALPRENILALAFNKKIADEMRDRFPENCDCRTLNALGHRVWMNAIAGKINLIKSKTYTLITQGIDAWPNATQQSKMYERTSELMRAFDMGQQCGYVPTGDEWPRAKPLMDCSDFFPHLDEILEPYEEDLIREATHKSIRMAFKGEINFNDQIFMPVIFRGEFPRYSTILVDEAQDLSALNHEMLKRLVNAGKKPARVIAVGDECQAIYGFRGAHQNSMQLLKHTFDMQPLSLTVSFRCSRAVTENAQWRAPAMKAPDWAKQGLVSTTIGTEWSIDIIPETAAIICRNNAPLFRIAVALLKGGRYPQLIGNDVVAGLIKQFEKWRPRKNADPTREQVMQKIADWEANQLKRVRRTGPVKDKAECLRVLAAQGDYLADIIANAKRIATQHGTIQLMTGHKAKGLEFDHVYFLDEHLISDKEQDPNIRYVIQTRSKDTLTYVWTDNCMECQEEVVAQNDEIKEAVVSEMRDANPDLMLEEADEELLDAQANAAAHYNNI